VAHGAPKAVADSPLYGGFVGKLSQEIEECLLFRSTRLESEKRANVHHGHIPA
jgi:hypothetical protein